MQYTLVPKNFIIAIAILFFYSVIIQIRLKRTRCFLTSKEILTYHGNSDGTQNIHFTSQWPQSNNKLKKPNQNNKPQKKNLSLISIAAV